MVDTCHMNTIEGVLGHHGWVGGGGGGGGGGHMPRTYFNIVDRCGILPYKRMYPYKWGIKVNSDILTTQ